MHFITNHLPPRGGAAREHAFPDPALLPGRALEAAPAACRAGARDGTVLPRIAEGFLVEEFLVEGSLAEGFSVDEARALARDPEPDGAAR